MAVGRDAEPIGEPPMRRSGEELAKLRRVLYPGTAAGLAPFVLERKSGSTLTDLDGNSYVDLASASASVPLGACRDDLLDIAVDAMRRIGNEDSHAIASDLMLPLAEKLGAHVTLPKPLQGEKVLEAVRKLLG